MLLTCEKCHTSYRLDERHLAQGGRVVRCTSCGNTWFEAQIKPAGALEEAAEPHFSTMLAQVAAEEEGQPSRAVTPVPQDFDMPVVDDRPGGLGPAAFGLCTFFLLVFLSVSALFLMRDGISARWPVMSALFEAAGAHVRVPGEGLSLSEMKARRAGGSMTLSGKVSNISGEPQPYPALRVTLLGAFGAPIEEWSFPAADATLASGETVPLDLAFENVPDAGRSIDVRVAGD